MSVRVAITDVNWLRLAALLLFAASQLAAVQVANADTPASPPRYTIISLGPLIVADGGHAINAQGDVVGSVISMRRVPGEEAENRACVWHGGRLLMLPEDQSHLPSSEAVAINDKGQILGFADRHPLEMMFHSYGQALLWEQGKVQNLNGLVGNDVSYGIDINNRSEVAVRAQGSMPRDAPEFGALSYLLRNGQATSLGAGRVIAFNDKGQALIDDGGYFLWQDGVRVALKQIASDGARTMNNIGQIVGDDIGRAFVWQAGVSHYLDTNSRSYACSINDSGQIVGYYYASPEKHPEQVEMHACFWQNGQRHDLNSFLTAHSGWILRQAMCINARGQIAGTGERHGRYRGFLLTPIK